MPQKTVLRIIILALIVIWMIFIFKLSDQNGSDSSSLSREVAKKIVSEEEKIDTIEPYIRKIAHLSEYAMRWNIILLTILNLSIVRYQKNDIFFIYWNRICNH